MAVTAKFQADFGGFISAIDKAEVALVDFGKGANKVEGQLNKMVDTFSGRKLIQEASLMTIAVEQVGGVSKLTQSELASIGTKANEAADKLKKLGYEVPAGLQSLADKTKDATKETNFFGTALSTATGVLSAFGIQLGVGAAVNFTKGLFENASALKDLSQQTHINVEDLQLLAGAMSEFGVDADELGKGLFTLSRKIAAGDDSVDVALRRMGLSLSAVAGLEGEELFLEIERGLSKLQGGLRDTTAAELFGSKLGMAMAGAAEGIDDTLAKARELNTVISEESIDAMDEFGESIERAQRNMTAIAANMVGPVAEGFNVIFDAAVKGASKWDIFVAMLKDAAASTMPGVGQSTTNLTTLLDHLNQQTVANTKATNDAGAAHTAFVGPLNETKEQVKKRIETEKELAKTIKDVQEVENARNALSFDWIKQLSEAERVANKARMDETVAANDKIAKAQADLNDFIAKSSLDTLEYEVQKIWQRAAEEQKAFKGSEAQRAEFNRAVEALAWEQEQALRSAADRTAAAREAAAAREVAAISRVTGSLNEQIDAAFRAHNAALVAAGLEPIPDIGTRPPGIMDPNWPRGGGTTTGALGGSIGGTIGATDPRVIALVGAGYTLGEAVSIISGGAGHIPIPHRQGGGGVSAGRAYFVGEGGPELFVPKSSGTVLPHGAGVSVTNVFHIIDTESGIARRVSDRITRSILQGKKVSAG